jgi:prephenate dehydratase
VVKEVVAFQGIQGAYSELAIRQHFGDSVDVLPCPTLSDLFPVIQSRQVQYGILPIENSLAGAVSQAYELLMDYDLLIQGEVYLQVRHALLAADGQKIEDLHSVRSHPQALAQCEQFLNRYNLKAIPWYDTAGSAYDLSRDKIPGVGVIASEFAGQLYGLSVLATRIEDTPYNFTRFFILGHDAPPPGEYNKTSIVFATRHRPSALYDCIGEFATRGLNLTKIESRPRRNRPWEPVFYLDFEGHWQDPLCQEALTRLLQRASFVKLLGSYPAVRTGRESVGI